LLKGCPLNPTDYPPIEITSLIKDLNEVHNIDCSEICSYFEERISDTLHDIFSLLYEICNLYEFNLEQQGKSNYLKSFKFDSIIIDKSLVIRFVTKLREWLTSSQQTSAFKLKVVEVLVILLELNYQCVDNILKDLGIIDIVLDLFVVHKRNSIMLNAISRLLINVLQSPYHLLLKNYIFMESKFLDKIIDHLNNPEVRAQYLRLFNVIEHTMKYHIPFKSFVQGNVRYQNSTINIFNELQKQKYDKNWNYPSKELMNVRRKLKEDIFWNDNMV